MWTPRNEEVGGKGKSAIIALKRVRLKNTLKPLDIKRNVLALLLLVVALGLGFPSGTVRPMWRSVPAPAWGLAESPFHVIEEAFSILRKNHHSDPQPSKIIRGAMDGVYEKVKADEGANRIQQTEKNEVITWRVGKKAVKVSIEDHVEGDLESFERAFETVRTAYYPEENQSRDLAYAAIRGMMKPLDPHSALMTPETFRELQVETKGEFGGIGIEITIRDGKLTVVSPIEGTPAHRLGIKANDHIIKIEDFDTKGISLLGAVRRMRGRKGTTVTIQVSRKNYDKPLIFSIVRDIIQIRTVKTKMLPGKIGYLRLRSFVESSSTDLLRAARKMKKDQARGLILDLRNNPGGLLRQAVQVSDMFLGRGSTIVYTKGKRPEHNLRFVDKRPGPFDRIPMVVLVNSGSASASEIVTGALQDLHRALVIGTRTFGKGSVQTIIPLSDGAGLRVTTALYYTSKGREIQTKGILPDAIVRQPGDTRSDDFVLEKEFLRRQGNKAPAGDGNISKGDSPHPKPKSVRPIELGSKDDHQLNVARRILDEMPDRRVARLMIRARQILSAIGKEQARIEREGEARP